MNLELPAPAANPRLLGQEAAIAALERAWRSGRLPHGWLFTGRHGVGKATLAFRFARSLIAGEGTALELPAGHPVMGPVAAGAHPDLVHVVPKDPKAAGKRVRVEIEVDAVRDAIARMHRTSVGRRRVLIVDQAHLLNPNAANALLKTLEEPAPSMVVILTAESVDRFPATIRSRVAQLRLQPVPENTIAGWLEVEHGIAGEQAGAAAILAGGSPGLAAWLLQCEALAHYERLAGAMVSSAGEARVAALNAALEKTFAAGDAPLVRELLGGLVRRAMATRFGRPQPPLVAPEPAALAALGRRLDRLWEVWDKLAVLDVVAERLSLDRPALLVDLAATLAGDAAGPR